MNINQLIDNEHFRLLNKTNCPNNEIKYIRACDLLSWVMAKGEANDAWITVQTHSNIVAVASLLEFSCIIIPESIVIEENTLQSAKENNIPIISTDLDTYKIFEFIYKSGL